MNSEKLGKGLVLCTEISDRFKTFVLSFNVTMPLDEKAAGRALLPYLLCSVNGSLPSVDEMNRKLARLYGAALIPNVEKVGESQLLRMTLVALDDRFALDKSGIFSDCLSLLCECFFHPSLDGKSFRQTDVEREKRLMTERIEGEADDKIAYARLRCESEMCANEAYGINRFGSAAEVAALNGRQLFELWTDMLLHGYISINAVGGFDSDALKATLLPFLQAIVDREPYEIKTEFITEAYETNRVEEPAPLTQSKLVIGLRAGMTYDLDNFAAVRLMTDIFGAGTYSKLFTNVREKLSLCYYCSARLYRGKGIILIQSGVETENANKALEAIRHELDEMRHGNFTDEIIEAAKRNLRDSLISINDSPDEIDFWNAAQSPLSATLSPAELADMLDGVSREEIMLAAMSVSEDTVYLLKAEKEDAE